MSGQPLPSPGGARSASTAPNGPLTTPTTAPLVNGVASAGMSQTATAATSGGAGNSGGQMSQQNLNQIVIDYLAKKGYHKTEATLRAESANQEVPKTEEMKPKMPPSPQKHLDAYQKLQSWIEDALDMYKPEVERLAWPFFVYTYLDYVAKSERPEPAQRFWQRFGEDFRKEHDYDMKQLQHTTLPEHLEQEGEAKRYLANKYRISLSTPAHTYFMNFLEGLEKPIYQILLPIIENRLDLRSVERALDDRYSFASIILRNQEDGNIPPEDEGIPGHKPGNAIVTDHLNVGNTLANVKLGKLQMDKDIEEEVRAEVEDIDKVLRPETGKASLVETHEKLNIKQEDEDDGPTRVEIPFPAVTARDVHMEVTKIRENRDRLKMEGRTGGIGPGISVCMYTFHNSNDSINCMDVSGDLNLIATGMYESYIRVFTLDGSPLGSSATGQPQASQRLIGHSGPVYSVAFAPSTAKYDETSPGAPVKWLLSGSGDGSIILWSLETFQPMVKYKGHIGAVWSVSWSPFGHYFVSGGLDKLGRVWMTDKMHPVRLLAGHDKDIEVTAYHPNAAYVFTASCDKTVRMWAIQTGNPVRMFTSHTSPITALSCSNDGKVLASADDTGSIILWDLSTGRRMKQMRGHGKGGVWSLSWSAESNVLVSGGADNTVRVWDVYGPPKEAAGNKPGEPGKAGEGAVPTILQGAGGAKKGRKDAVVTADQISAFPTKSTPVYYVKMTGMNLALAAGAFLPELSARPNEK
jgi:transcription initiation factor TFIID subunit 5